MSTQANQGQSKKRKIYLPTINEWVPVTEEVYREYYRPIWRIQKAARKNGQCVCPKTKLWSSRLLPWKTVPACSPTQP